MSSPVMRATIVFDEENIVTPPEDGLDDLLRMLADVMTAERVSGTFFVTAQRAQLLRQRGRAAMARPLGGIPWPTGDVFLPGSSF